MANISLAVCTQHNVVRREEKRFDMLFERSVTKKLQHSRSLSDKMPCGKIILDKGEHGLYNQITVKDTDESDTYLNTPIYPPMGGRNLSAAHWPL